MGSTTDDFVKEKLGEATVERVIIRFRLHLSRNKAAFALERYYTSSSIHLLIRFGVLEKNKGRCPSTAACVREETVVPTDAFGTSDDACYHNGGRTFRAFLFPGRRCAYQMSLPLLNPTFLACFFGLSCFALRFFRMLRPWIVFITKTLLRFIQNHILGRV